MSYTLTLKVESCTAPEGDYYVIVAKNKADKKEKYASQTPVLKKSVNPTWNHPVEMPAAPTDELLFELYRSKKLYATASLVVGLIDSGKTNEVKMTFTAQGGAKAEAKPSVLKVWATFVKAGTSSSPTAPNAAASSSTGLASAAKKDSLRSARGGTPGSTARPITTTDASPSTTTSSSPPPKKESKKDKNGKKTEDGEKKQKKKHETDDSDEENDHEDPVKADSDNEDEEFVAKPPRRKPKKTTLVPQDEDPADFWNGVSKSKNTEKKKEIKKLQMSLESMTINLKSSWKADSTANDQQRFAVMIHEIGLMNNTADSCAGQLRVGNALQVRLAFDLDITVDKASGCGIDPAQWIYIELLFSNGIYVSEAPSAAAKTLLIRQCPPMSSSDEIKALKEPSNLGLWWTLEQRLSEHLRKEWNTIESNANKAAKSASKDAAALGTSDAWAILQILEWPSSELPLAMKALGESKNDVKMALELILDQSWLDAAKSEMKTGDPSAVTSDRPAKSSKHCESSFLRGVVDTIKTMIQDAGKYCPICGDPHPLELFKPIVCDKDLCRFQFSNMGLGVDFESELVHSPHAVDLLIALTANAPSGTHFDPMPTEVSTKVNGITYSFKTPQDVSDCLGKCPSVDEMIEMVHKGTLRQNLADRSPLLYLLLRWIVTSSRAHLHYLSDTECVPQIDTPHQFHLKSTPPEKEQKFYAAKKRHGSFYAWHGSATSNWHSILRNGLKNYSGSKHQVNGAAYGAGVYMAVDSGTSIGYSWRSGGSSWQHSRYTGDLIVVALCEVINDGELICTGNVHRPHCLHCPSAPFYRIEKDEYIITRYLFVVHSREINVNASSVQDYVRSKQLLRSNKAAKSVKK